ncbi:unnamed protein product [Arabidopsis arenosa]|uniref:Uncharacterized protein n=1 Tax=Arabidopsis arenosa TaxID=38785 RepID=A0A8S2A287_ARAAE|nr:unnamed protein product [Arabidopsis arenosa]
MDSFSIAVLSESRSTIADPDLVRRGGRWCLSEWFLMWGWWC